MKSKLFESLNDRSNIANAYYNMISESEEENASEVEGNEETEGGFFDDYGYLAKEIPEEAVKQCSQNMGHDNYEDCKYWVEKLGFDKGLDIEKAKEHLLHTGGYTKEELDADSDEEIAIKLLWDVCCTLRENEMDLTSVYLGESTVNEHVYHAFTVALKNIEWSTENAEEAEEFDVELPTSDEVNIEADSDTDEDIMTEINNVYIDSYGFAPEGFDIVRKVYHGERDDGDKFVKKNDSVEQPTLKDLQKVNPDIEEITEENDDEDGVIDSDYDENGVYHEFPKTNNKINRFRQKFHIHTDGSSKFDELTEELHDALDGCTKGFFTDNQYSVVEEVLKRLRSIGVFATITKIENAGIRNSDGLRAGKDYHFDASWTNKFGKRMTVHGIIKIFFAGTVDDPESRYDACVTFYTDDGNYIKVDC